MYASDGAVETIDSLWCADSRNVVEHPIENADLRKTGDDGNRELELEQDAWWNLHVVAEFEVRGELESLRGGNVSESRENHVCDGASREHDATDELADEIDTALLVGDSHHYADRDEQNCTNAQCQQESVPW